MILVQTNLLSKPFISEGCFCILKEVDGNTSYPGSFDSYRNIIERTYQAEVDKSLISIFKDQSNVIDNRFNFY